MTDFALISRKEAIGLGLKRYFTGKPCKKGHIFQRRTEKGDCVLCAQKVAAKSMMERRRSDPSYRAKEAVDQKRRYSENNSSRTKRLAAKRRWQKGTQQRSIVNALFGGPQKFRQLHLGSQKNKKGKFLRFMKNLRIFRAQQA